MPPRKGNPLQHLPPEKIILAMYRLRDLEVSPRIKAILGGIIETAAAPDPTAAALDRVDKGRKSNMTATETSIGAAFNTIASRGKKQLRAMSDEEFNQLIEESLP